MAAGHGTWAGIRRGRDRGWRRSDRLGAFVDAPRTTPGLPQPGIAGNWWVLAGITFVILGLLVLLLTGGHMCWSYWRSRPRRHPTRRERRERKQAERETQSTSQASRDEDERRRAEQVERNRKWQPMSRLVAPVPPWGPESVELFLHAPHEDTYAQHTGKTALCEVWRGAHVHRAQAIPYDGDHGLFRIIFPDGFDLPDDPWLRNPEPIGGYRDGTYRVVWRFEPNGPVVAEATISFKFGRLVLQ
jgi:hypothetical protein